MPGGIGLGAAPGGAGRAAPGTPGRRAPGAGGRGTPGAPAGRGAPGTPGRGAPAAAGRGAPGAAGRGAPGAPTPAGRGGAASGAAARGAAARAGPAAAFRRSSSLRALMRCLRSATFLVLFIQPGKCNQVLHGALQLPAHDSDRREPVRDQDSRGLPARPRLSFTQSAHVCAKRDLRPVERQAARLQLVLQPAAKLVEHQQVILADKRHRRAPLADASRPPHPMHVRVEILRHVVVDDV
jgi:hypothetical protein